MRILLTRPRERSEHIAELLRERGHRVLLSPVIDIRFLQGPELALAGMQAILVTSANGVRALALRTPQRDVPVYVVGPQTANAARAAGFMDVRQGEGDAAALAESVIGRAAPQAGALLHAAGRPHNAQLAEMLSGRGFAVRVEELYEAVAVPRLGAEARDSIVSGTLDAAMLFSPRSATILVRQVQQAGLAERCATLTAFCISEAAADALAPLPFAACAIAEHPDRPSMLALVDEPAQEAQDSR